MATSKESRGSKPVFARLNTVILAVALLILLAMVGLAYREWRLYSRARAAGLRLLDVQSSIETLVASLLDAETAQHAFLLSGDDRYLEPYNQSIHIVPTQLANLNRLVVPPVEENPDVRRLRSLVEQQMSELRETIELRRNKGAGPAAQRALSALDRKTMDAIRTTSFAIRRRVNSQRSAIQVQALTAVRGALLITTGGSLFMMGLLVVGYRAIHQGTLAQEQALADMRSLHELGMRLMRQGDLPSLLGEILAAAMNITGADMGNIQLLDAQGALRIEAQQGFSAEFLEFFNVQEQEAACRPALERRERIVVEDVERSPIFAPASLKILRAAGVRAVQSTPLVSRTGVVVGMLSTHYRETRQPSERDLRFIDLLAREAADLIEKIRAEEALRLSEERYRATFDTAAVGIAHVGLDGRWLRFNDALCTIIGYSREELGAKTFGDVTHPDDLEADWALARRVAAGEIPTYSLEKRYLRKDGTPVWVNLTVSLLRDPSGAPQHFVSVVEDISHRKRAEDELRATEQQLLSITDNMSAAVTRFSRDSRYVWVSRGYAAWIGFPADAIAGRYIWDVIGARGYEKIHPYLERVLAGERVEYTAKVHLIGPGERWIQVVDVPVYAHDQVDGWIAVVTDITDILQAQEQLRATNRSLARANEDLERFAFAASHDLQEPLRMITTYSQLLIRRYPDRLDADAGMFVNNIVEGTQRMRNLLADLLAYTELGSRSEETTEIVDLNVVFDRVRQNLKTSIAETTAVVTSDRLPQVQAYAAHFTSLIENLIGNAIKYRGDQPPRIHLSAQDSEGAIRFAVADNGIGIDPKYHQQIFEVFKRLHSSKIPGTGVGLAICKRVVERYGGRIWVESNPGEGATFFFTVPAMNVIHERLLAPADAVYTEPHV